MLLTALIAAKQICPRRNMTESNTLDAVRACMRACMRACGHACMRAAFSRMCWLVKRK